MKAEFVKNLSYWNGSVKLYRVSPPVKFEGKEADHIVVSKVRSFMAHETCAFPADKDGEVVDWGELKGSMRGEHTHEEVIRACGYSLDE